MKAWVNRISQNFSLRSKLLAGYVISVTFLLSLLIGFHYQAVHAAFKTAEREKAATILSVLDPMVSAALELDSLESVREVVEGLFRQNPQVLAIRILSPDEGTELLHLKNPDAPEEGHAFRVDRELFGTLGETLLARVEIRYSASAYQQLTRNYQKVIVGTLLTSLLFLAVMTFGVKWLLGPLKELSDALMAFNPNRPDQVVELTDRNDEVGIIQNAIHQAIGRTIDFSEEIKFFNAQLEEIVEKRTRALQESESQYRNLVDRANDGIVILQDGLIRFANPQIYDLFGEKGAEIVGRPFRSFLAESEQERVVELHKARLAGREVPSRYETVGIAVSGKRIDIEVNGGGITHEGRPAVMAFIRDITDRKRQEEALKKSERELRKLNESLEKRIAAAVREQQEQQQLLIQQSKLAAMGEMIGNIAHQWRQPLAQVSGILMNIEGAYEFGELDEKYLGKKVEQANELLEYMTLTIDDFKNFFSPDKAQEEFNVKEACQRAVSIMAPAIRFHHIRMEETLEEVGGITGYPNEYAQVLLNILTNAKDILLERKVAEPKICIRLTREEGRSVVRISDNGGGVRASEVEKVFEPYYTTKHESHGTGIGLYMSKMIIEKNMGGTLSVANEGEGAVFTVTV